MIYESNMTKVLERLKGKLKTASEMSALQRTIATNLKASNLRRIHNDGRAVDGSPIGQYNSNKPLYVNPNRSPRKFKPVGRNGRTVFASGKKAGQSHKTRFFANYSAFRQAVGRPSNNVNLQLTGTLLKSWQAEKQGTDWILGFNSKYGKDISEGQETKWNKLIWGVSKADERMIDEVTTEHINRSLNNA